MKPRHTLLILAAAFLFCGAAVLDLRARARSAYLEGEKYMAWAAEPALKKTALDKDYADRFKKLEDGFADGSVSRADYEDRKGLLETEKTFKLGESSAKYAYIWYRTAARDFNPPATRWSRLAEEKSRGALALWKKELDAAKIKYEDYMLE